MFAYLNCLLSFKRGISFIAYSFYLKLLLLIPKHFRTILANFVDLQLSIKKDISISDLNKYISGKQIIYNFFH